MVAISVVLLLFSGLMLVIGLAVRFSGRSTVFIVHEPEKVKDMAALNRYAGNRLLLVPLVGFPFGVQGLEAPVVGLLGGFVTGLALVAVLIWVSVGVERFKDAR